MPGIISKNKFDPWGKIHYFFIMLSKEKIEHYKQILEKDRARLLDLVKKDESPEDFGSDVDSFEEEAGEAEALSAGIGRGYAHRVQIEEIEMALKKISEDTYGKCENCGKEISEKVLDVVPESQLCEDCKKKAKK